MGETRRNPNGETLIFPCAGAAHTGQVAYRTALQMTADGRGKIFCLAAVSAEIEDKLQRARDAARRVAIDGCEDHCARKTLERAGLPVERHLVLTEIGIQKQPATPTVLADTCSAIRQARLLLDD